MHSVKKAALQNPSTAALSHDTDAAFFVQLQGQTAVLVKSTGLTQSPAALSLIRELLGFTDDLTAWLC